MERCHYMSSRPSSGQSKKLQLRASSNKHTHTHGMNNIKEMLVILNNINKKIKKDKNIPESWANCPHSRHF